MDPVEAGSCLAGRPQQLIFLTGLDPSNRPSHVALVNALSTRTAERLPLNLKFITGELDLPLKAAKPFSKGIIKREWPEKYLSKVPALIVLFIDLDWDHHSWNEKKTEVESKCASIRASSTHGSKLAVVLLQDRNVPTPADDPLAMERAHELCQICQLSAKQLFVVPVLGDMQMYATKLEGAFHELAQAFYQAKLKTIRSRSIPNNSPALVVRQMFKMGFLSEFRQDTHIALRNYRLAYDHCKDHIEQWDAADAFEWRSVAGLLNYKICELCFLHSTAVEAVNQIRRHQSIFFQMSCGHYPTPQLASIEHLLWKSKQCWHFAQLFENAVVGGLSALASLNPGTHLDLAASLYNTANAEIAQLKQANSSPPPYPNSDPMARANETIFFGQRPWRIDYPGLAPDEIEKAAVCAIMHRLVVNRDGVISLLSAAMSQYKKYSCWRMQKKIMNEMANVYAEMGNAPKALQLWSCVVRDDIPPLVRDSVLRRALWLAYTSTALKEFVWCCVQMQSSTSFATVRDRFLAVLAGNVPPAPLTHEASQAETLQFSYQWSTLFAERQFFTINCSRMETFLSVAATFLDEEIDSKSKTPLQVTIKSTALGDFNFTGIRLSIDRLTASSRSDTSLLELRRDAFKLAAGGEKSFILLADMSTVSMEDGETIQITKVEIELGDRFSKVFGLLEFDTYALNKSSSRLQCVGSSHVKVVSRSAVVSEDELSVDCLVGEVASTTLKLRNTSNDTVENVRLEFERNEQSATGGTVVLFVDKNNELRPELQLDCAELVAADGELLIPLRFSAQRMGAFELKFQLTYICGKDKAGSRRTSLFTLTVNADEPLSVKSSVLTMNGVPVSALLNHSEHVLKVDVTAHASLTVSRVEWLLADLLTLVDGSNDSERSKSLEDELDEDEVMSYTTVAQVSANDDDGDTPLGRIAVEWSRRGSDVSVRSVVPLARLQLLACPISVSAAVLDPSPSVQQPVRIRYTLYSHSNEVLDVTCNFDLIDSFIFAGDKRTSIRILPGSSRILSFVLLPITPGRLPFPRFSLKCQQVNEAVLLHALRTLPATLFVLPRTCESNVSTA